MAKPLRICTNEDAFAWIAQQVESGRIEQPEVVTRDGEQLVVCVHECTRCGGSGSYYSAFSGRSGVCFGCNGRKVVSKRLSPIEFARRLRRNMRARERREAARRARVEASKGRNLERGYGAVTGRELFEAKTRASAQRRRSSTRLRAHVGVVGGAVELSVVLRAVRVVDTRYGQRVVHEFLDDAGNVLTMWWREALEVEGERPRLRIRAEVKGHGEWRGEARTELGAVEVLTVEGEDRLFDAGELLVVADYLEQGGAETLADVDRQALAAGDAPVWLVRELSEHPAIRRGVFALRGQLRLAA